MSTKTADGPTPPGDVQADVRTDVTGVGGVTDASNEQASKADAQVDVLATGGTGVSDVSADSTESLPTAGEDGDDSGFNTDKTTDDSGPTATFGDSDGTEKAFTDGVTTESLEGNQNKDSAVHVGYDPAPFYDQPGLSGGSANQGTEPSDEVGKPTHSLHGERVDVLQSTTTPENNSGKTDTWSGTESGSAVERQADPVTDESMALGGGGIGTSSDGWTSHFVGALKLVDQEEALGLLTRENKYARLAELEVQSDAEIAAQFQTLARVKTAGLAKLAQQRTASLGQHAAGVGKLPALFGQHTAAPGGFQRVATGEETPSQPTLDEDTLDSALFSR